jgi:adenine deaminase
MDMVAEGYGYLDHLIRLAMKSGIPPIEVIRMVTINPAEHYRKAQLIGSITPGRFADIVLLRALDEFPPELVITNGRVVAQNGKMTVDIPRHAVPEWYTRTIRFHESLTAERLKLQAPTGDGSVQARVIRVSDSAAYNTVFTTSLTVAGGYVQPDIPNDILKIVVVERYGRNGNVSVGFVHGFGLQRGAIASSVSIPSNNIVSVGAADEDIWVAIRRLGEIQGGFVVTSDREVKSEVNLRVGGVMSEAPYEEVVGAIKQSTAAARSLGCKLEHPFFTMAQTILHTIPEVGLSDKGLVDARASEIIPVLVDS